MSAAPRQHAEALRLMMYQCEACGHAEILWNSRDGVTPFGVDCVHCGGDSFHVHWERDVLVPTLDEALRVYPGLARIFVDAKPHHEHLRLSADHYVEQYWDDGMSKTLAPIDKAAAKNYFLREWTKPGSPTLLSLEQYRREHVKVG